MGTKGAWTGLRCHKKTRNRDGHAARRLTCTLALREERWDIAPHPSCARASLMCGGDVDASAPPGARSLATTDARRDARMPCFSPETIACAGADTLPSGTCQTESAHPSIGEVFQSWSADDLFNEL